MIQDHDHSPVPVDERMRQLPRLHRDLAISVAENVVDLREHHRRWAWIDERQRRGEVE